MKGQAYEKFLLSFGGPVKPTKFTTVERVDYLATILNEPEETRKSLCRRFSKEFS